MYWALKCGVAVLAAVATVVWFALPAAAQGRLPCNDANKVAQQLAEKYDEEPVAFGVQSNGNLLQIYASEHGGTWTVVSTNPAGISCIVAAGKRWESLSHIDERPAA